MSIKLADSLKINFLQEMLLIRFFEEKVAQLYTEQEMRCPVHLSIGQEAAAVGMCQALTREDCVVSGHRAHSHYIAKGGNLNRFLAELYGKATGCCRGIGGSMHLVDRDAGFLFCTSIVGGSYPVAVGVAHAQKQKKLPSTTTLFLGDAGVEEGVFHECLNFAALHKLPMIFFCENNLYSVYTPLKLRQPERPIYKIAEGHGIKTFHTDGNDVEKVFDVAKSGYDYVKSGQGPVFIEVATYRHREHCGPNFDNDLGYRSVEEFLEWEKKCPIKTYKEKLICENILDVQGIANLEKEVLKRVDEAVEFAKSSPFPEPSALYQHLYAPSNEAK